ncbi:protein of unknown function [Maridesulfovibrio hydrothermalis AM13 = DSM 14728]|uniref:Uncharacterized protein n=1 Tax=Maridesulfovibrio hydrothermalis AM13 = DSM 14728 TaxID=1121451 RepID=L0RD45_9BACT|nr:protein of unknown function [Maridesulfovibrio hydrothermalis AM13 = DSM 14728]
MSLAATLNAAPSPINVPNREYKIIKIKSVC